jgi:hypothetical protein
MFENFREHKAKLSLMGLFLLFLALKITQA